MVKLLTHPSSRLKKTPIVETPRQKLGVIFDIVQLSRALLDGKTFVDCIPKKSLPEIRRSFKQYSSSMSIAEFVEENFQEPPAAAPRVHDQHEPLSGGIIEYIGKTWHDLTRSADEKIPNTSLLPLPYRYVVPGGRFREIYYWDSYFTMMGLFESGEHRLLEEMVQNFAHLIETYGYIPNGNRSYYIGRSQPPFFALMVELLAKIKGDPVYADYIGPLTKEYSYWMQGARHGAFASKQSDFADHVVRMPDGELLNRYFDVNASPREESFAEDTELARHVKDTGRFYRDMRAGAESGWDYSARWFNGGGRETIRTTDIVPVDLNALLYMTEEVIAKAYHKIGKEAQAEQFRVRAGLRAHAVSKYLWNEERGWFVDYIHSQQSQSPILSLAGMVPLFAAIANDEQARRVKDTLMHLFLREGGVVNTLVETGEQWDSPNGWAPMHYLTIMGLERYGFHEEAKDIANRWCRLVIAEYRRTGTLMEKYDVEHPGRLGGGGEYPLQEGFGWTNGVQIALMKRYGIEE